MNRVEIMRITLTCLALIAVAMAIAYAYSANSNPLYIMTNILKNISTFNCKITDIRSVSSSTLTIDIHCEKTIPENYLRELNCLPIGNASREYECKWKFRDYTVKTSSTSYEGHRIYTIEVHTIMIGPVQSRPAVSATSIVYCSSSGPRCTIMVYGLTTLKNILVITPRDVRFLYCDGLTLLRDLKIGSYEMYVFTVTTNIKLTYSSKGVFFSKCAVISDSEASRSMLIGNISLGVAAGIAAGLLALLVAFYITLRRH